MQKSTSSRCAAAISASSGVYSHRTSILCCGYTPPPTSGAFFGIILPGSTQSGGSSAGFPIQTRGFPDWPLFKMCRRSNNLPPTGPKCWTSWPTFSDTSSMWILSPYRHCMTLTRPSGGILMPTPPSMEVHKLEGGCHNCVCLFFHSPPMIPFQSLCTHFH